MRHSWRRRPGRGSVAPPAWVDAPGARLPVLFVNTPVAPPLGADTWVHAQIMRGLDRSTHELHARCARGPAEDPTPTYRAFQDIPDVHLRSLNLGPELTQQAGVVGKARALVATLPAIAGLAGLALYVRRHRIPVIHTSDRPRDAAACVLLARLTGARSVIHVHVGWAEWMSPLLQRSLRRADALVAVSEFVARTLDDSGHDPARTHVVLNAIDPAAWVPGLDRDATRRELDIADGAPVVLTVCRLFPGKGPSELIRALAKVRTEHPDVRLLIVGGEMASGYARELADLAAELGLADNVVLTGRRSDVARLMAAADVYAMPSLGEPFGLVFVEAMAMRLPVVALDSGGAPEIVEHGRTGLLCAPGDVDQLATNLCELIAGPERRARMGALGRQRVEEHFTIGRMARDMAGTYRAVLAGRASEPRRGP